MGKVSLRSGKEKIHQKVEEIIGKTVIHQRQVELAPGRWDFLVFGPCAERKQTVVRVGVAEQMMIQRAEVYLAAVGDPEMVGAPGFISIEELTGGDVSAELEGLEVYHVAPLRPLNVLNKRTGPSDIKRMRDKVLREYSDTNIAIIETPDEEAWGLSVLMYLNECDEMSQGPIISMINNKVRGAATNPGLPGRYLQ